jgi:hypothetical protein
MFKQQITNFLERRVKPNGIIWIKPSFLAGFHSVKIVLQLRCPEKFPFPFSLEKNRKTGPRFDDTMQKHITGELHLIYKKKYI